MLYTSLGSIVGDLVCSLGTCNPLKVESPRNDECPQDPRPQRSESFGEGFWEVHCGRTYSGLRNDFRMWGIHPSNYTENAGAVRFLPSFRLF